MSEGPEKQILEPDEFREPDEFGVNESANPPEGEPEFPPHGNASAPEPEGAWPITPPDGIEPARSIGSREIAPPAADLHLFDSWTRPEFEPQPRIPHFGHVLLLSALASISVVCTSLLTQAAVHFHLFGVTTFKQAGSDIHYTLGWMGSIYVLTLAASALVFPLFWHKGFLRGMHWRGITAIRLRNRLFLAAFACFLLAMLNSWLMPGPPDTPIDKMFRTPLAAWLMFGFGVTFAPFFEELAFRGFFLPAMCTAIDWIGEKTSHEPAPTLDMDGHPEWSVLSMIFASILVSIPFALMHAEQTGYSLGPFLLLVCVSLVLCWVRLTTRSLAASVIVHSCYNLLLFSLMLLGTSGFRHLERM